MKYLTIFSLLMTFVVSAQEEGQEQNKKRPSWSEGLPERQATMSPTSSMLKQETQKESVSNEPVVIEKPVAPTFEVELVTEPMVVPEPMTEIKVDPIATIPVNREKVREQYFSNEQPATESLESKESHLIAQYKWKVLKTTPVEIPGKGDENDSLKLIIQINPKGHVTRVLKGDANMPSIVLKSVEKSIRNWRFQPPSEIGITENISKTFTIDVET